MANGPFRSKTFYGQVWAPPSEEVPVGQRNSITIRGITRYYGPLQLADTDPTSRYLGGFDLSDDDSADNCGCPGADNDS